MRSDQLTDWGMWAINNETGFAAERNWVRDRDGAEVWIVSVKGTYTVADDGHLSLAEKQEPVVFGPKYRGEPTRSSLLYETDLMLTKAATDVVLNATAYAPYGQPVDSVDVSVQIDEWRKTLRVYGDRQWQFGGISSPDPFRTMPITYERAFGGVDEEPTEKRVFGWEARNPVGTGFATSAGRASGLMLPNIEDARSRVSSWKSRPAPAGFGAIAAHWSPRVELAGTYDERWQNERLPLVPDDFSERFYQVAPVDQQLPNLRGGERVVLRNLTASGELAFRLPRVALAFDTDFKGETVQHRANLHTVIVEPDVPSVMMVWQTSLACHSKVLKLRQTTVREKLFINRNNEEAAA
jgi:hypothetical protein